MAGKIVEFSTRGTRFSITHRQLVVERPEHPKATLPIEDLGVVIVDDVCATYTQSVFIELLTSGVTLIITGRNHLPLGMMLPLAGHHIQTERHRAQLEASLPTKKRIWQAIVSAKIAQQGDVLLHFTGDHHGLIPMARRVRSGDPNNLEAVAAQRYWPRLFGKGFRRHSEADGINALLNYGYGVIRAAIARALVATGLIPSLGVFHRNRANPFCLADDLLEAYRPFVDWRAKTLVIENGDKAPPIGERSTRAALLSLFNETVLVGGRRNPMLRAIDLSASSLGRALTGNSRELALPEGLPLDPELLDCEGDV